MKLLNFRILIAVGVILAVIVFLVGFFVWQKYPFGVKKYKTIEIGMAAAEKANDHIVWAPPYDTVPESDFYVYSLGDEAMCISSDCGMGAYFVECLGGWISGYKDIGEVADYGLREVGVNIDKQKIITIADKDAKIVGIYPGAGIRNLPYIMNNHRNLASKETFNICWNMMPQLWK
ncbi:MAG: hypothetical protein WCX69_00095 [Candidatus Paceibacterota bacterium]